MDTVVKENIKKFLSNVGLFYSIIKDKLEKEPDDMEDIIPFLKMQHSSNKSLLIDLGVTFDDTTKIRALNEQVRSLEKQIGKESTIDFESISKMIDFKTKDLERQLQDIGIYASCSISVSSYLNISISIYSQDHQYSDSYSRNEDEKNEREKSHNDRLNKLMSNFETYTSTAYAKSEYILHSENNIEKIKQLVLHYFGHSTFATSEYESKIEDDRVYISKCVYSLPLIDSYKNFIATMNER